MSDQVSVGETASYFKSNSSRTQSKFWQKKLLYQRENVEFFGSRELGIHYSKATGALYQLFGAARIFVPTSQEGETDQPYHKIKEMYVGNLQKLKAVKDRITKYDMVVSFNIPVMVDLDRENPALLWGDETTERDILFHWLQVDLTEAIKYHRNTYQYTLEEDMTSSDWVKDLMVNSSEAELKQRFDKSSRSLNHSSKVGSFN